MPNVFGRKLGLAGTMSALLVSCAFATPASASSNPSWLSPVKLSVDGSDAQTPVIAMDGNGDSDAVWSLADGTLQTSFREAGPGDPFAEQDVGGSSGSTQPDVSEDGSGDAEAVWLESGSVNWSYRTNDVDGFGGASGINNDPCSGSESDPKIDVGPTSNPIAVYLCNSTGTETVEAVYAASGTAGNFNTAPGNQYNVAPVPLSDGLQNASNIQIAEDPNGDAIVVWQESDGTNQEIWYAYRPAGNTSTWTTAEEVGTQSADETTPTVAMDGSGNASIAYVVGGDIDEQDATNTTLAAGSAFGSSTALSTSGTASQPEIADDANGDTAAIWGDGGSALANVRPSGGSFAGSATNLGTVDAGSQPQIALTSTDDAIALWQDGDTIQAETADSSGAFSGTATQLSGANATEPSLAVDNNGDAVAAWIQSDGTNEIVTADGYDSGADPVNNNVFVPPTGTAGTGLTFYAQPYDVWPSITSVVWKVDGTQVGTGDTITWVPTSGSHTVSVTSTNQDGQTTTNETINIAASAPSPPVGALTQLASPNDCITTNSVGCGTFVQYGLTNSFQPVVSPDGKNVYVVGQGGGTDSGGLVEFSRNTTTGALTEIGCITGAASVSGCTTSTLAAMDNPSSIAISPDGADVYVVTQGENAIVTFSRNATTGLLSEVAGGCYSSNAVAGCTSDPGLQYPWGVVVAPDGKNVYATASSGHDIAEFTRNTTTGALTLIPGNTCISDGTTAGCVETGVGLLNIIGVQAFGSNVYGITGGTQPNGDIAEFTRNATTGALSPIPGNGCIGGASAPSGCLTSGTDVDGSEDMTVTPDGQYGYSNSFFDDAIVEWQRNTTTGALSQIGCVGTSSSPSGLCSTSNTAGIDGPLGVAVSPDGANLYASGSNDNAEAAFTINTNGTLTQLPSPYNCISSNSSGCGANDATGLAASRRLAVSPDGKDVYVANQGGDGIVELARTPQSSGGGGTKGQVSNGTEASWDTGATASSVSATVTVPAIVCSGTAAGTYAGQAAGIELYGQETISGTTYYPASVADVRTYCQGSTPEYETTFVVNDETTGDRVFHPAGLTVSPGDPLEMTMTATASGQSMEITDVNTGKSASITGPGFVASDGADIGVQPIGSNGHGAPMVSGSESTAASTSTLDGPVESSPVVFQNATVDGQPVSSASTFYGLRWVNASKTVVATASSVSDDDFAVDFASVQSPVVAKSGDAAPVSGKVLIELPGTHKFVPLTSIKQIPNGTIINATHGSVQITVALPNGQTETGVFYDGEFKFEQSKSGQVTAQLTGGSYAGCPKPPPPKKHKTKKKHKAADAGVASSHKKRPKSSKVRSLWSNAHGNFTTKGRYGAAAVNGTQWFTQDQCDGTYFKVTRDAVTVTSFSLHNKKTVVTQGHHFLAPAPGYK